MPVKVELPESHPLATPIAEFLADLQTAGRSEHTVRCYRGDLTQFAGHHIGKIQAIDAAVLRGFFAAIGGQATATRARKQSTLASFLAWCRRQDLLAADPMTEIERAAAPRRRLRPVAPARVRRVLDAIPKHKLRDRALFELIAATGLRACEALGAYVEDLDLRSGSEQLTVTDDGDRRRTVLLDDPALVVVLRRYLKTTGYTSGVLFRAEGNRIGGPLRYSSACALWANYCATVNETISLRQLCHAHGAGLVNVGARTETVRKHLGHRDIRSTLPYAGKPDPTAAEIRPWRRLRRTPPATIAPATPSRDTAGAVDLPRPARARVLEQPSQPIGALAEQARRTRLARQRRDRSGPPVRALACPTCGHEPTTRPEALRQRQDLAVVWLHQDSAHGPITRHQHCARCQSHDRDPGSVAVFECARCGDGPILTGTLAAHINRHGPHQPPAELRAWLTDHGWQLEPQPLCPHERPQMP